MPLSQNLSEADICRYAALSAKKAMDNKSMVFLSIGYKKDIVKCRFFRRYLPIHQDYDIVILTPWKVSYYET